MRYVILVSMALLFASCGDDGPDVKPTTNSQQNNESNNNSSNNNNSNNLNNPSNNSESNNEECVPSAGGIEVCDGLDNDCNGLVDDSPAFDNLGEVCSLGVGACAAEGVYVCSVTKTESECDAVAGEPATEVCDDTDNDCDGEVDEGFDLGTACSAGEGACGNDGVIACLPDGTAACNAVAGTPGGAELCNSMDDNCDGDIDEAFPTLGQPCSVGVGACAATGVYVCSGDELGVVCSAVAGTPGAEVCDGIDNDCDGDMDEGFNVGQACTAGVGVCQRSGQIACLGDGTSACNAVAGTPPEVSETTCDGLDNDCDGVVDENCDEDSDGYCKAGFVRIGTPAVCPLGGNDCNDNDPAINPGAMEVCDGVDNNCNGSMDIGAVDASTYYLDCDGDNFAFDTVGSTTGCATPAKGSAESACNSTLGDWTSTAPVGANRDCHPNNPSAYPGQTAYFSTAMASPPAGTNSFDFNCSGSLEPLFTTGPVVSPVLSDCPTVPYSNSNSSCSLPEALVNTPEGSVLGSFTGSFPVYTTTPPQCGGSASGRLCSSYARDGNSTVCRATTITANTSMRIQYCR